MKKTEDRQIGADTYRVTQLGALVGRKVLFRLGKLLGPLMAGINDPTKLASGLEALQEADFEWLCNTLAGTTDVVQVSSAGPVPIPLAGIFDSHFAGHYGHLIAWLVFAVQVNFRDFLAELPDDLIPGVKASKLSTSAAG